MNIRYYFQNVNEDCKNGVENFFSEKKIAQIERLLQQNEHQIGQLNIRVEYFEKHNAFSVKAELAFGKKVLFGEEQSHDVKRAVTLAVKRLLTQLKK
ncbi:MAG: HPF/RaiA family ribosome-associated protein [Candidatus Pacebacteria bacterium]|nr:HPF/RaiA family ribosome-associated protein [Candidatus Paceibacterota bacterium]